MKFNSSINFSFFGYIRNEWSTCIKYFNCSWSTKSSHSRADIFTFFFICFKWISSFVFFWFWRIFLLFRWGCPYFHFLVYNINSTSSLTLTYSNLFLFTTASFHFLIYNFNMIFSPTLTYYNLFLFTTSSFHFLIYNLNMNFSPTLTHYNIFLFTTSCFNPMWYVRIKFWIGGVTCCSTCSGSLILKAGSFGGGLDVPLFLFSGLFFFVQFFNFRYTLLLQYYIISYIKRHISRKYNPYRRLNYHCIKSKNIWLRFIPSSFRTSMLYLSQLKSILYCSNSSSLFAILMHGTWISNGFFFIWRSNTFLLFHICKPVWILNTCKIQKNFSFP